MQVVLRFHTSFPGCPSLLRLGKPNHRSARAPTGVGVSHMLSFILWLYGFALWDQNNLPERSRFHDASMTLVRSPKGQLMANKRLKRPIS
jgi:hypothetical protein